MHPRINNECARELVVHCITLVDVIVQHHLTMLELKNTPFLPCMFSGQVNLGTEVESCRRIRD